MYMANHNLNVQVSLADVEALVPDFLRLHLLNADNASRGSLLTMGDECVGDWHRPPSFLLVDFYNVGNGSVFEVAAKMNGVTYIRACCGKALGLNFDAGITAPRAVLVFAVIVGNFARQLITPLSPCAGVTPIVLRQKFL